MDDSPTRKEILRTLFEIQHTVAGQTLNPGIKGHLVEQGLITEARGAVTAEGKALMAAGWPAYANEGASWYAYQALKNARDSGGKMTQDERVHIMELNTLAMDVMGDYYVSDTTAGIIRGWIGETQSLMGY